MGDFAWPGSLATDVAVRSDVVVTWVGAFGALLFLRAAGRAPSRSALHARARFLLAVLAGVLFLRGFAWIFPDTDWLGVLFFVPASLLPLAMTVFAEGLLRRHLTPGVKRWAAAATGVAFVANLVTGLAGDPRWRVTFTILFLALLLLTMITLGIALLGRDRATLSRSENALVRDAIVLAVVAVVLVATDFREDIGIIPVRAGTIAVLLLAFVLLSRPSADSERGALVWATRLMIWGIAGAALVTFVLGTTSVESIVATVVVSVALVLLVGIANRAREVAHGADIDWLLRWLARPAPASVAAWERAIRELPITADAIIVNEHDLRAYHLDALRRIAEHAGPVIPRLALAAPETAAAPGDALAADELADLLERNEASHIGVLSVRPLRLILVTLPEVPGARGAELALASIVTHGATAVRGTDG